MLLQGDVWQLMARKWVDRLRAAGIEAGWETGHISVVKTSEEMGWTCSVWVAQSHLICALILWRLRGRRVEAWLAMAAPRRRRLALRALVDGAVQRGGVWEEDAFTPEGLYWLRRQLGLGDAGFREFLDRARWEYERLGRRDLRWGAVLASGCLFLGMAWGFLDTFGDWPPLILLVLALVLGVHTLAYSLPRVYRAADAGVHWLEELEAGERLLREGKARESIVHFERSIRVNPGEAGTANAEEAAREGIRAAKALLRRRKK